VILVLWVCAFEADAVMVAVNAVPFAEYPQPETHNDPMVNAATTASRNDHWLIFDRLRVFAKPNKGMNPHGKTQPKASLPSPEPGASFGASAVSAGAMMITVLMAGAPMGVTLEGLNLQVVPVGNPEQVKLIGRLNPASGIKVIVSIDGCPGIRVTVESLTTIAYPGARAAAATLPVITGEVDGELFPSPP
jgi:hypothetical protein